MDIKTIYQFAVLIVIILFFIIFLLILKRMAKIRKRYNREYSENAQIKLNWKEKIKKILFLGIKKEDWRWYFYFGSLPLMIFILPIIPFIILYFKVYESFDKSKEKKDNE